MQACKIQLYHSWESASKLLDFNQVQCKICQVTDFLLGEFVPIFHGCMEGYFIVYVFVLINTKYLAEEICGYIWETGLHALGYNLIPADKEVSPPLLPVPLQKQSCCAEAIMLCISSVVCVLRQESRRVSLLVFSPHSLTAAGSWRIDKNKCVEVHVTYCVPSHHGSPGFYLCYSNLQDLFGCCWKQALFVSPVVLLSGEIPSAASSFFLAATRNVVN